MTTIAYRDGVMAADTQMTSSESTRMGHCTKVWKIKGYLVGFAGTQRLVREAKDFLENNLKSGEPLPRIPFFAQEEKDQSTNGVWGFVVCPQRGIFRYEERGLPWEVEADYIAVGSGSDYARAAMYCGKDAIDAVAVAMHFDCGTGGEIRSVKLGND